MVRRLAAGPQVRFRHSEHAGTSRRRPTSFPSGAQWPYIVLLGLLGSLPSWSIAETNGRLMNEITKTRRVVDTQTRRPAERGAKDPAEHRPKTVPRPGRKPQLPAVRPEEIIGRRPIKSEPKR
jgi:hypothetical protein